jgi:hypothetical protein
VLLEARDGVAVKLARATLEGRLAHHTVDVVQHKTRSLRVAGPRLPAVVVRHQVLTQQVPRHSRVTDVATDLVAASLRFPQGPRNL